MLSAILSMIVLKITVFRATAPPRSGAGQKYICAEKVLDLLRMHCNRNPEVRKSRRSYDRRLFAEQRVSDSKDIAAIFAVVQNAGSDCSAGHVGAFAFGTADISFIAAPAA